MTKFMNTTTWLRDARERRGGGVPVSGRNASLAVFGTMGPDAACRCPNSPLPAGFVFMVPCHLMSQSEVRPIGRTKGALTFPACASCLAKIDLDFRADARIPSGRVGANMAKLTASRSHVGSGRVQIGTDFAVRSL